MHQLLGLGVQGARGMNLLEVVRVALARVEVTAPEFRHFSPHQNGASNELEGDLATTRPRVQGVSWNRQGTWAIPKHLCGQLSNLWPAVWKTCGRFTVGCFVTEVDYSQIGPALGDLFPDFELPDSEGRLVSLHSWRNGRRAIVVFYRSAVW